MSLNSHWLRKARSYHSLHTTITTIQVLLSMEQDDLARIFSIDIAVQTRGRQRLKKVLAPSLEACRMPQNRNLKAPTGFTAT